MQQGNTYNVVVVVDDVLRILYVVLIRFISFVRLFASRFMCARCMHCRICVYSVYTVKEHLLLLSISVHLYSERLATTAQHILYIYNI